MVVERGIGREPLRLATTVRAHLLDVPPLVGPRDVRDPLPVGGPGRYLLVHRVAREAPRDALRHVHHVHLVERAEREPATVRGRRRVANLLHEHVPRVHARLEAHQRPEVLLDMRLERNGADLSGRDLHAPDLAAVRNDQRLGVGRERRSRHEVAGEPRLLIVALHRVDEPLLVARDEVPQPEPGLRVTARRVHQPVPVGGEHGTHRAPVHVGLREHLPRLPIVDGELPQREVQVVAEAAAVARIPHVAHVRTERGSEPIVQRAASRRTGRRPLVLFREAHPRAPVLVVQPDVVHRADRHPGLRGDDVIAVGSPLGRGVQVLVALGERAGVRPIGVADPDVLRARAIGEEHDLLAVGRVAGLRVERGPRSDPPRVASRQRQQIQVAEQLEHDGVTVGRHIERDPGPFRGREVDGARRLEGQAVRSLCGQGQRGNDGGEDRRGQEPAHQGTPGWETDGVPVTGVERAGPRRARQARVLTNPGFPAIIQPER